MSHPLVVFFRANSLSTALMKPAISTLFQPSKPFAPTYVKSSWLSDYREEKPGENKWSFKAPRNLKSRIDPTLRESGTREKLNVCLYLAISTWRGIFGSMARVYARATARTCRQLRGGEGQVKGVNDSWDVGLARVLDSFNDGDLQCV
ncbi:hypothetical protein WG66_008955 [Moniliophthora roreri]|nr:hypothetical protein WG66_008955 [Moniliophthora roreri]